MKQHEKSNADTGTKNKLFNERENPFYLYSKQYHRNTVLKPCMHVLSNINIYTSHYNDNKIT